MQHTALRQLIRSILIFALSICILTLIVFIVSRLAPGDPLVAYFGERAQKLNAEERTAAIARLGLDKPIYVQFLIWLCDALHGDFGLSYKYKTEVLGLISSRVGNTLLLGGVGYIIIFIGALALGIFCAYNEGRVIDKVICRIGTLLGCIPEFWMSLILIMVFSLMLHLFPSSGAFSVGENVNISNRIRHLVLPLSALVLGHLWYYAYMVRNRLCEELRADYVLMARAKGLSKSAIIMRHCVRNIFPTYLSVMAVAVAHILGGTYIIEMVFSYPGLGTLMYESARYKDYNLLMVLCMMTGICVLTCSSIARLLSACIDPRLRYAVPTVQDEDVTDV